MKTLKEVHKQLKELEHILGFDPLSISQGSPEWIKMKLGVQSASKADCLLAKKTTQKYQTYLHELVAQVATGVYHEVNSASLSWGKENEESARQSLAFFLGTTVSEVPFIYKDKRMRAGCSPDNYNDERGSEIKCPYNSVHHVAFIAAKNVKPEYVKQCQFSMWVTDANIWDFASHDPRFKKMMFKNTVIERDEELMSEFNEKHEEFNEQMDLVLSMADMKFGDQWDHYDISKMKKEDEAA